MEEIKAMSEAGLKFLKNNEGCILHPYRDSVGIATIGIGNTFYEDGSRVKMTDHPITEIRAMELFKWVLRQFELTVYTNTRDDITKTNLMP